MHTTANKWKQDSIQFPRLLAEIMGIGLSTRQYKRLREEMDLTNAEINELFDRADAAWQKAKLQHTGIKPL